MAVRPLLLLPSLLVLWSCGLDQSTPADARGGSELAGGDLRERDSASPDAPTDAATDPWTPPDALLDLPPEAETRTDTVEVADAVTDSAVDLDGELPPDSGVDTDVIADTGVDTGVDTAVDAAVDAVADVPEEVFSYAWEPDGPCGTAPYDWLPPTEVGGIVSWQPEPLGTLPASLIEQLLQEAGYPALIPVNYGTRVFRLRYLTQDHGVLTEATAMVGIPDVPPGEGTPLETATILYLHPTLGFGNQCALSGTLEGAAAALLPATMGFIAVAPDYLGLCGTANPCEEVPHPYLVGEPTALASWDAVRAAHSLLGLIDPAPAVIPDGRVVPWGHSQGGHAALFTDRYGPVYAPEYTVPCVLSVVPPGDLAGQALLALDALDGAARLGTAFMIAAALWYDPPAGPESLFNANGPKNYATWLPEVYPTTCNDSLFIQGATYIDDLYAPSFLLQVLSGGIESVDPWGCIALQNSIPHAAPPHLGTAPVLYLIAENDELVDRDVERAAVAELCAGGYAIDFLECSGGSHTGTAIDTIGHQVSWLFACLNGQGPSAQGLCVLDDPVDCSGP
ncbi:MAG: hypothetical protein FJ098_14360 [Deltaproteobacteria bacterium]|nr:hypothetical protein [Deltaproteobacteria bacterium]